MEGGITHFHAVLFFAAAVSVAFAFHSRLRTPDRLRYALKSFLLFVGAAILIGWLMYPFSR
jgi:hypothetical protein